jgi:hypothetical protein
MARRVPITAGDLSDHQVGTDDNLTGAPNLTNVLYGDAGGSLLDHAIGGNDSLTGGTNSIDFLYGDACMNLLDHAIGGNDTLTTFGSGSYDSRISSSRRPSPFKSFFTALEATTSPSLA